MVAEQAAAAGLATVTGLPQEIDNEYDDVSDSEPEDEADEDGGVVGYFAYQARHRAFS